MVERPAQLLPLLLLSWMAIAASTSVEAEDLVAKKSPFTLGDTLEFHSRILGEDRILNVYLPLGYGKDPNRTYPVIYLLDGSADEDFIHIAGLVQFGSFPWLEKIPETLVVGIANVDRKRDFTYPSKNEEERKAVPTSGGSAAFLDMLSQEIQPLVERTYRVGGPKTLIGQSLGGLVATEILFKRPELFNNYIIVSPSLWWDHESLLKSEPRKAPSGTSVYIAVGIEGEVMERVAEELHQKLAAGSPSYDRLWFRKHPELDHADTLHLSVYHAFEALFGKTDE